MTSNTSILGPRQRRKLPVLLTVSLLLMFGVVGALNLVQVQVTAASSDSSYYELIEPTTNIEFPGGTGQIVIDHQGAGAGHFQDEKGLICTADSEGDAVLLTIMEPASIASISLDISKMVLDMDDNARISIIFQSQQVRVLVSFDLGMYSTAITYVVDQGKTSEVKFADLFYDRPDNADLLVQVRSGEIETGLNGIGDVQSFSILDGFHPSTTRVEVGAGEGINSDGSITIFRLQGGEENEVIYHDTLHKTIVPDGKDFTFSLQIHADKAYLQHFEVMADLSLEYGLKGTYDAWWRGNYQQYGMESPEYVAALHLLQDAGWDIGIHAGSINDLTREQIIAAIEDMTMEFGEIMTWSDHGARQQDLWKNGTNESSPFFVKDLVAGIGAAWVNNKTHSHSIWNDLNRQGLSYVLAGDEELPLFRVSKQQAQFIYYEQGRQQNTTSWLRALSTQRSVFVAHDYFPFFCFVRNDTGDYSVLPSHDGIMNTPWSQLMVKRDFLNDTWYALPCFVEFLEFTRDYDVWFATVREVYDRSCLVQNVAVEEDSTHVTITNSNPVEVQGFTLFSNGQVDFDLLGGGLMLTAAKGTADCWHFIMTLEPGEVLVLEKVGLGDGERSSDLYAPGLFTMEMAVRDPRLWI